MTYKNRQFNEDELRSGDHNGDVFVGCRFAGADLKFVNFDRCRFEDCDLTGLLLDITSFTECAFPGSKLSGIDFADVSLKQCDFSRAVMSSCVFHQLAGGKRGERKKMILKKCVFDNADLSNSAFIYCDLFEASFSGTNLREVAFENCNLEKADLSGADIGGVVFGGSKIQDTILDINGFIQFGSSKGFVMK